MVRQEYAIAALISFGLCCVSLAHGVLHAAGPRVDHIFPSGVSRGQSVVVTFTGDFPRWPVQAWTSDTGIQLVPESDKGKFRLSADADVAPGIYWLRCVDEEGASSPRPIIVGTLPEIDEAEPNDTPEKPQIVNIPVTINGRLARNGDVDAYSLALRAGQTLVASLQANTDVGSPMDAVLQICWLGGAASSSSGIQRPIDTFVLDQVDDTVGLDPRLAFSVSRNGTYLVRVFAFPLVPNSTIGFAGGDNFIYRLTLTTGAFIDFARPLAVQSDAPTDVELHGWNIPDSLRKAAVTVNPGDGVPLAFLAEMASHARLAWVDGPALDYRPSGSDESLSVDIPVTITGRLDQVRQQDKFTFRATNGRKIRFHVMSRSLGFAADPLLRILDGEGKTLAEVDDVGARRDPELVFTAPADGHYQAVVQDVHGHGSPRGVYQLAIDESQPNYGLTLGSDSYVLTAGKTVEIPVTIDRREGFAESIEISADDLPAGVTVAPVVSEPSGSSAKSVKLVLVAAESSGRFSGIMSVYGVAASLPDNPVPGPARVLATYPLKDLSADRRDVWLTVTASP